MKKQLLFLSAMVIILSCAGVRKTEKALNTGNYMAAMNRAIENLSKDKDRKSHQPYVLLLEDAFEKNSSRALSHIDFLKSDNNPANFEAIYNTYVQLDRVQERIRPLLPLEIYDENRMAYFNFQDYNSEIIVAKENLSDYLYAHATDLMNNAHDKYDFRKAYDELAYLQKINPGYRDTREKMEEAHARGIDYVKVEVVNATQQIVPARLEEDLMNFNTFGLNDYWTQYHNNEIDDIRYDYAMRIAFKDIAISPERIRERQIIQEKQIKDGYEYLYDEEGNVVRDSLGNKIKVDRFRTVTCEFYEFTQQKSALVSGDVQYIDLQSNQQINTYPLASEAVFEHVFADYYGDKRALDSNHMALLNMTQVPFPSNEQMVYDAGEDLKLRLKDIIVRHRFN